MQKKRTFALLKNKYTIMTKINIDYSRAHKWIAKTDIASIEPEIKEARNKLLEGSGEGNDFLGWIDLPSRIDNKMFESIEDDVRKLSPKSEIFVVIGIGGSYLGARAVIESLQSEFSALESRTRPFIVYAGHTLSESYYHQLLQILDDHDYSMVVISKSGTTTEPAIAFRILKNHIENKYGKEEARTRIIAITDASKGALREIATQEQYKTYIIPDNVGGRFSVLTPVGLLPIAMAGFNIRKLVSGAHEMQKNCLENDDIENPALLYAALRNILYRKGRTVEMQVNYLPNLRYISEWWKQLYGESEGKDGKGILPHSLSFTTDLHSMGQYVQEGLRLMFESVLSVKKSEHSVAIPYDGKNHDGLNYLIEKSLTEINHCAEEGTTTAHESGDVPVIKIKLPEIDETIIGQLLYFFEFACGVSGYTLGVNPFNQPGVEAYKKNMFKLLGKPGF